MVFNDPENPCFAILDSALYAGDNSCSGCVSVVTALAWSRPYSRYVTALPSVRRRRANPRAERRVLQIRWKLHFWVQSVIVDHRHEPEAGNGLADETVLVTVAVRQDATVAENDHRAGL